MNQPIKQRGYDDTELLTRMARGLILREFSSVDDAAKTVIGDAHPSNAERLRRKFREQNWYERGLQDYVTSEIERRSATECNKDDEKTLPKLKDASVWRRAILAVCSTLIVASITTALYPGNATSAGEDPRKVAQKMRASVFATSAVQSLYGLSFADLEKQVNQNVRFFLTPGGFTQYVDSLAETGLKDRVRKDLAVVTNEVISEPEIWGKEDDYSVILNVKRKYITATAARQECLKAYVYVMKNRHSSLGTAEFGLVGIPTIEASKCR